MHQEPADKFRTGDRDCLLVAGFVVTGVEGHHTIRNAHDSGVGNSDFVGISSEVLNRIAIAVEGLFDEAVPILRIELVAEELPLEGIIKGRASFRDAELSIVI